MLALLRRSCQPADPSSCRAKMVVYHRVRVGSLKGGLEIGNDAGTDCTLIANACVVVSLDLA